MPTYAEDYAKIEEARKRAGTLGQRALKLQAGAETFSDRVMKDVRAARAARGTSMLAQDIGTTTEQLATGGPEMRARMAMVNPLQVDVMTARQRAGTLGTLATQAQAQAGIEGTIQDVISGGVNQLKQAALLKQAEAQKAAEEANTLLEQVQLREAQAQREFDEWAKRQQIAQGWAQISGSGGIGGIAGYELGAKQQLQTDVMGGASLKDVMAKYATVLSPDEILRIYNVSSPYGPAKETARELERMFGIKPTKTVLEDQKVQDVMTGLENLAQGITGGITGAVEYNTKKTMIGQYLARLVETGRLSDQDRIFYQKQLPSIAQVLVSPSIAQAKIRGVIDALKIKTGIETGGEEWQDTGNEVER